MRSNRVIPDVIPEDESLDSFKSSNSSFAIKVRMFDFPLTFPPPSWTCLTELHQHGRTTQGETTQDKLAAKGVEHDVELGKVSQDSWS